LPPDVARKGGPIGARLSDRINIARGGGAALPSGIRGEMEGAFGVCFADIRVHSDSESRELNRGISARAFTIGSDVFLGDSASANNADLIAHELAHAVQQRTSDGSGTMKIAPADDRSEHAAKRIATQLTNHRAQAVREPVPSLLAGTVRLGGGATIQRYQAGERGHGGIEQEGLRAADFSGDMGSGEIGAVYFGNWMRDFSQLNTKGPSSLAYKPLMAILNILTWGEFNRPLDPALLGGYLPSEHLDNPLGGKTAESSDATAAQKAASEATLSEGQKAALKSERESQATIAAASGKSGLPPYIEAGKQQAKDKLKEAVLQTNGRDAALRNLGAGLHAIEDYFSHSNFIEVALAILAPGNPSAQRVLDEAQKEAAGFQAATAGGKDPLGRGAGIITGTYGDEPGNANQQVSLVEQLRSEVLTGSLRKAFVLGSARVAGKTLGSLLGNTESKISTMPTDPGEQRKGELIGEAAGGAYSAFLLANAEPLFLALTLAVKLDFDLAVVRERSSASAKGAPGGLPTHSQVAKDSPEHPAFWESRALAVQADTEIGRAVRASWQNPNTDAAVNSVLLLVDKFVAHPSENRDMWEPIVVGVLKKHKP